MRIKLNWQKTGDTLFFDVINQELATWFVEQSCMLGDNKYRNGDQIVDILSSRQKTEKLIEEEKDYIALVNQGLEKLRMPLFTEPDNYYDQKQLNRLHKDWGETRQKWPKLSELFFKLDKKLFEAYQEMNCHIHFIEQSFEYTFRDPTNWRTSNPFKDKSYDWEVCHLYIVYPGHGREAFEKFKNMDTGDDIGRDNVNWDNIDSCIGINLVRPYKLSPPPEFLFWCKENNLIPHCDNLPLANLSNWQENLTNARQMFTKNVTIKDNYFYLELKD